MDSPYFYLHITALCLLTIPRVDATPEEGNSGTPSACYPVM
jgi:hypothetical protein